MKGEFANVNLPGLDLANIKWPTLTKVSSNIVESKVMELNPQNFGNLLEIKKSCQDLWEPLIMVINNIIFGFRN